MKLTLSWLKAHLETGADVDTIAEKLTALGLEVEEIVDRSKGLEAFKVAHVISAEKHPDADKLRVCMVDTGTETVQVVCGAPNARTGMKGVFAPTGSVIPATGVELKKGVIRGVESNGMLCSEREMGLSDAHEGIIDLPADAAVGTPFAALMGLDDPLIDISLTPDRADCAGVRGVARDLAATGLGQLRPLETTPVPGGFASPIGVTLDFPEDAAAACPLFVGRLIRGVSNGPSPRWLQDRLMSIGLRPISALVDITNLLTFDIARPLHVFDAARLSGGLTVRFARAGETLRALNDKEYTLDETMTVIADDKGVVSLGGVMGGEGTGVTGETTDVFLEAALFDPVRTARTGRKLSIDSDARYRFERGVDPAFVVPGAEIATRLILEICGGEASELVIAGAEPAWRRELTLRPGRVLELGGVDVPVTEQVRILEALGFGVTTPSDGGGTAAMTVLPPSWRADIHGEADLVEEVLRVHGYDHIPAIPMVRTATITRPALSPKQKRVALSRRVLAARGLSEAVTWSFMSSAHIELFGGVPDELRLLNPISADLDVMRPSILPNLIQAVGRNSDRGYPDVALFEVGPIFRDPSPRGQDTVATGVRAGTMVPRQWAASPRGVDAFDVKADAIALLESVGAPTGNLQVTTDAPSWYHPGRSGVLRLGPTVLARFGEVHPGVLDQLGVKGPVVAFEVMLDAVPVPKKKSGTARPLLRLSLFQPIQRDFAFLVDAKVEAEKLVRAAKGADKQLITDVSVFDVYQGQGIEPGFKSLAIAVTIQPSGQPLTEPEIDAIGGKIVAAVTKATGGVLRG
ncbi:phenylalanyl-tRNA synthetase subunit beta [Skermanella stibiiresistens SB22]|uniref:Phenylalanine--tRNA ligase beta subunit n=1 Tax=Skermanella stibiiresistens SB22 TaxID=1385369 RepID=W9GU88_9PROT|nr:phenylalanine--tRNA ligase subunit beta [Skermanella stibiiresistens]EWY37349.1 phenylalanyl-tRNA synthetase subunit beta [Skermanella stibiiresistens SB22]